MGLAISTVNVSLTCLPNGLSHIWVRGPSCLSTSITTESTTIMPSCLPALTCPRLRARLPLKHSREWAWAACNRNLWAWEDHLKLIPWELSEGWALESSETRNPVRSQLLLLEETHLVVPRRQPHLPISRRNEPFNLAINNLNKFITSIF